MSKERIKILACRTVILIGIPALIAVGVIFFSDRKYNIISVFVALLACVPFFIKFEKQKKNSRELIILAVMITLSTVGRFAFAAIPGFKPITAMVIITSIYFGSDAGFITGAFSAILSNIYFGQGPWTPFQMLVWGIIGYLGGFLAKKGLLKNRFLLSFYGIIAGVTFSLMMDIWTVISMDGIFNLKRYFAAIISSLPFMLIYAVSNVIFLLLLEKPIGKKLERIKTKYQINLL